MKEKNTKEESSNKNENIKREGNSRPENKSGINGSMGDNEYFKDRLQAQIDWHGNKASENKSKYKKSKTLEFILAASIPVVISLTALGVFEHTILFSVKANINNQVLKYPMTLSVFLQIMVAGAGIWLAIVNKRIELEEYYKNWKEFRAVEEHLQNHKIMYLTGSAPYNGPDAYSYLVENTESILSQQIMKWQQTSNQPQNSNDLNERAFNALDNQQASWAKTGKPTTKTTAPAKNVQAKNKVVKVEAPIKKTDEKTTKDDGESHG